MKGVKDAVLFTAIHDFLMVYLPNQRNCSPHTIRSYKYGVGSFLDFVTNQRKIPLSKVTFEMLDSKTIVGFLDDMETTRGCSVSTRNGRLNALRAFFHYSANTEPSTTIYQAEVDKVAMKKEDKSSIVKHLSEQAMKAVLEQPNVSTKKGLRDQFLMILLYDTGARIQEILSIRLKDLRLDKTSTVTVHGKNMKMRSIPLMEKTVMHLRNYLNVFHLGENLHTEKPLFYVIRDDIPREMCLSLIHI